MIVQGQKFCLEKFAVEGIFESPVSVCVYVCVVCECDVWVVCVCRVRCVGGVSCVSVVCGVCEGVCDV